MTRGTADTYSTTRSMGISQRRLGGSKVRRLCAGEYTYSWGTSTWLIIRQQAASDSATSARAWHVYLERKDANDEYWQTFVSKADAIAMLNVEAFNYEMAGIERSER